MRNAVTAVSSEYDFCIIMTGVFSCCEGAIYDLKFFGQHTTHRFGYAREVKFD